MSLLEILKFKNVYGIKNLISNGELSKSCILYAPNGSMKSSFTNGLYAISSGEIPKERVFGRKTEYVIKVDGNEYTNEEPKRIENIITFSYDNLKLDISTLATKLSLLTISTKIREEYNNKYLPVEKEINEIIKKISRTIIGKKKDDENINIALQEFNYVFNCTNWYDIFEKLAEHQNDETFEFDGNYIDVFNEKTLELLSEEKFVSEVELLKETINKKIVTEFFTEFFDSVEAEKLSKVLLETKYFSCGHKLLLKDGREICSDSEYSELLKEETNKLYGDSEIKGIVENLIKKLEKNEKTKYLKDLVKSNNELLKELGNLKNIKKKIIMFKILPLIEDVKNGSILIKENSILLNDIISAAKEEENEWKRIIKKFHNRFDVPFDIEVVNSTNSIIGKELPTFSFRFKDSLNLEGQTVLENDLQVVLSTGQLRAMKILYFLFDVEHCIKVNGSTIIIMDDIVDSFDYKNKYAMIEYILDIQKYNVQTMILTHNFDFFTTCRNRLKDFDFSSLIVVNHDDKEVIAGFNGNVSQDGIAFFNNWKKSIVERGVTRNKSSIVALIPVIRNLLELREGSNSEDYKTLCKILHYRDNTENIIFANISKIFENQISLSVMNEITNEKIYNFIMSTVMDILLDTNKDNIRLEDKLCLAIAIRLNCEKFLAIKRPSLLTNNSLNFSYREVESELSEKEKEILSSAIVMTPEFIHINSFMYEPLIDIGIEKLKDLYKETITLFRKEG